MAGPRCRAARHVHERVRLLRGQRRHPRAAPGPRQRTAGPGADRRRLRAHLLPRAGHRRAARRPLRTPARLLRRHGRVHARVGAVRAGSDERHPGRRPPLPGRGGRDDGAPGTFDHPGELPGAGAPHRPRRLRDDHRRGAGQRAGARRDPPVGQHLRPELAADLPRQRARGRPHVPLRLPPRPRVPVTDPPKPRPGRRRPAHHRRRAADHPDRRGRRPRLAAVVLALPCRRARRRRGVRVVGAPREAERRPAAPRRPRPVPVQGLSPGVVRERDAVRDDHVVLLRPWPVPAGGTRGHPVGRRADVRAACRGQLRGEPVEQRAREPLRPQHADRGGGFPGRRPPRAPRGVRTRASRQPWCSSG